MNVRSALWSAGLFALALLIFGCGGGGSGSGTTGATGTTGLTGGCPVGTPNGSIQYSTTWGTLVPADSSQVLQVIGGDGAVVATDSINRDNSPQSSITMTNITPGIYELRVQLFSGRNATGTVIRTSSSIVNLCTGRATAAVQTKADDVPLQVVIGPDGMTVNQNSITPFVATVYTGGGVILLVPPGDLQYSADPSIGTITGSGIFTAVTAGTGMVHASLSGTNLSDNTPVTVQSVPVTTGRWTILVYMNAANDLFSASDLNMNQMERVAGNPNVRFVVQWKQSRSVFPSSSFDGVRRYLVKPDNTNQIASQLVQGNLTDGNGNALDMGSPTTLKNFIEWAKASYPADRYVLVLWNHGNGWRRSPGSLPEERAWSYDDQYGTSIKQWETATALAGQRFDIIAWDCSLMQMMEVAYETAPYADYIVGSEESPPAEGYPYDDVFRRFRDAPTDSTANLSKGFVDGMLNYAPYANRKITQSVFESAKLPALVTALSQLADAMRANSGAMATIIPAVRNNAQSYSPTSQRVYRDIVHLCQLIEGSAGVPAAVLNASIGVRQALAQARIWEGHNGQSPNSNGLAIDFSSASVFNQFNVDYGRLRFAADSSWDEFLITAP